MPELQNEQNIQTSNSTPINENQSNDEKKKFAMFGMWYSIVWLILIIISLIISNILLLAFWFLSLSVWFVFFIVWWFRKLKDNNQYKNKHNKGIFITSTIYYIIWSIFIIFSWLFIRTWWVWTCLCVWFILLLIWFILRKIGLSRNFSKKSWILVIIFWILFILFILCGVTFLYNHGLFFYF